MRSTSNGVVVRMLILAPGPRCSRTRARSELVGASQVATIVRLPSRPTGIQPSASNTSGPNSRNIWAPELHRLRGKWYVYFAADDGQNRNHRMFALENASEDPFEGTFVEKGRVFDPAADRWAIDGTAIDLNGRLYFLWSGWEGTEDVDQRLYIAPMSDPWTISGPRVEISRRLLAVADKERSPPMLSNLKLRRSAAVLALVGLPVLALAIYLPLGSPRLADFPLAERARAPDPAQPLETLVAQVEQRLENSPTDGRGWTVLAPVLARLGRFDEAIKAFKKAITYGGDNGDRRADLGEAIAGAAGGVVTTEAKAEFDEAIALDPKNADAHSDLGLLLGQQGHDQAAMAEFDRATAINPMNVVAITRRAALLVHTAEAEGFGLPALEAMACGRPVIGSAVGGLTYTIKHGETGFLVPPRDPEALADRLQKLRSRKGRRTKEADS